MHNEVTSLKPSINIFNFPVPVENTTLFSRKNNSNKFKNQIFYVVYVYFWLEKVIFFWVWPLIFCRVFFCSCIKNCSRLSLRVTICDEHSTKTKRWRAMARPRSEFFKTSDHVWVHFPNSATNEVYFLINYRLTLLHLWSHG